jgi:hypothetical protein
MEMEQGITGEPAARAAQRVRYERLDLGKIIAGSFNIYKLHFGALVFFYLLLELPMVALLLRYSYLINWAQTVPWASGELTPPPINDYTGLVLWGIGMLIYSVLIFPYTLIVPARMAGLTFMGKPARMGECIAYVSKNWWMIQGTYALFGAILISLYLLPAMLMMFVMIPGMEYGAMASAGVMLIFVSLATIYLIIRIVPLSAVVAFDRPQGTTYDKAKSRLVHTFRLTRQSFGYVAGVMAVTYILMSVARYVLITPLEWMLMVIGLWMEKGDISFLSLSFWKPPIWITATDVSLRVLGTVVAMPFEYIVASLLYFDLRFRQEGLDIELNLANASDPNTDDEAVAGANTTY